MTLNSTLICLNQRLPGLSPRNFTLSIDNHTALVPNTYLCCSSPWTINNFAHCIPDNAFVKTPTILMNNDRDQDKTYAMADFAEENRKAFNVLSANYNAKPWQKALSLQVQTAVQARKDWLGVDFLTAEEKATGQREVRLLDYACGTGSITQALVNEVSTIRGIDISENMVAAYNTAARAIGLDETQAWAAVGDLFAIDQNSIPDELRRPEFFDFDLAVIALGFHHFADPGEAIKRIVPRLKPGSGVLCIIDFLPKWQEELLDGGIATTAQEHGGSTSDFDGHERQHNSSHSHLSNHDQGFSSMQHTIKQDGFAEADMRAYFNAAGLVDTKFDVLAEKAFMAFKDGNRERHVFLARAQRPDTDAGTNVFTKDVPR